MKVLARTKERIRTREYYETELGTLYQGDCLEVMDTLIKEGIKVDAIIIKSEIWKPVLKLYSYKSNWKLDKKYEFEYGLFFVSNLGNFYGKNRGIIKNKPDLKLDIVYMLNGKRFKIHQIVLQTFKKEGVKDFYTVDHINRYNRLNNTLLNLRWANRPVQYKNRNNLTNKCKKVSCCQNNKIYNSCKDAEIDLSLVKNTVARVARGDRSSIHGFTFRYL